MSYWAIWRAAMPQALLAKKARETHNDAVLSEISFIWRSYPVDDLCNPDRAFEKWHQAYKTKTHLKEIA
jgi:protein SFI1